MIIHPEDRTGTRVPYPGTVEVLPDRAANRLRENVGIGRPCMRAPGLEPGAGGSVGSEDP
ncbi:hypothetical protein GCM10020220_104200 [Nonomuraea rubra]